MGIRGLTTYISNNSHLYLSKHKLQNCTIVIDGNNLAFQLYLWVSKSNSAFGGDYDRYHKCVCSFFELLKKCNITPLVIFDGGYEVRKLGTVWLRLKNKFLACRKVNPNNQLRRSVFPLLMRDFFHDILSELGVSFAQCDFEADVEIAALARDLQCPVLSYDSDFYVYDVLYIPFDTFKLSASSERNKKGETIFYVDCHIYKVERFLSTFGGLRQDMLPLMATLLGNDYIKRDLFNSFLAQIRMPKKRRDWTEQHRRIAGLLDWLRKETITSAIPKILNHLKTKDRGKVERQMRRAIDAYALTSSSVKNYLVLPQVDVNITPDVIPDVALTTEVETPNSSDDECEDGSNALEPEVDQSADSSDDQQMEEDDKALPGDDDNGEDDEVPGDVPTAFLHKFRQGMMPACFMDLLTKSRFYILQPQKEDFSVAESSHAASMPLIRHIVTLLLGADNAKRVSVITRRNMLPVKRQLFSDNLLPDHNLPSLTSLSSLSQEQRLALLLQPTEVTVTLDCLPQEWRLYFLAIAYWASHTQQPAVTDKHVHAAVLGVILLALVRPCKKENQEFARNLSDSAENSTTSDVKTALRNVSSADCRQVFSTVYLPHSHAESRNHKGTYDLSVVHSFAQLQSSLLCLTQLNQLLNKPLQTAPLHRLFSGTLLYNLYRALQPRADVDTYLSSCLKQTPTLLAVHQVLTKTLLQHLAPSTPRCENFRRTKPRRKRKREVSEESEEANKRRESDCESDSATVDPNNRFALLSSMM